MSASGQKQSTSVEEDRRQGRLPPQADIGSNGRFRYTRHQRLPALCPFDAIPGMNVTHLRPGFFMEGLYDWIGVIKSEGRTTNFPPDLALPFIAARDVGGAAASELLFPRPGIARRELLGHRDLSMLEATRVIGEALGLLNLQYVQLSFEEVESCGRMVTGVSRKVTEVVLSGAIMNMLRRYALVGVDPSGSRRRSTRSHARRRSRRSACGRRKRGCPGNRRPH
jgi:hypothetical protein